MRLLTHSLILCLLLPTLAGCPKLRGELQLPPVEEGEPAEADAGPDAEADADDPEADEPEPEAEPEPPCGHFAEWKFAPAHDGSSQHVEGWWWSSELGEGTLVALAVAVPDEPGVREVHGAWHDAAGDLAGELYAVTIEGEEAIWGEFVGLDGELEGRFDGWFGGDAAATSWAHRIGGFEAGFFVDPYGGGEVHGVWQIGDEGGELHGGLGVEGPGYGWAVADLLNPEGAQVAFQEGGWEVVDDGWGWYGGRWVAPAEPGWMLEGLVEAEWVMHAPDFGETFGSYFAPQCVPDPEERL